MNYISVEQISKSYGDRLLFENISFNINKGQKIAFIAKNGSGKTSILNIISGIDTPDSGNSVKHKDVKISYLRQKNDFDPNLSVEETLLSSDNPILQVFKRYKELESDTDNPEYSDVLEKMETHNAWDFESKYKEILYKLKLQDLDKKISLLSGGQKKRLSLAMVLLENHDLMILDEPTNHLDLEMIEWLEKFLQKDKTTLFIVTHDRYFLERVCDEIIELDEGNIYKYKGSYSYFLQKKDERIISEQKTLEKAKNLFRKELDWMKRQPKARTTKSKSRIDDFYKIKEKSSARRDDHSVQLEINMTRLGNKIVEFHKASKSFDDNKIIKDFEYHFKPSERIGIIGKNGTGKTTFLNILTGSIEPDKGKVIVGETVKFGYYNQNGIEIKKGQKVIEVIREVADYIPLKKGRKISAEQLLEKFLFDRKKQYDFVEKLSGGEQKRLYLCLVLMRNPNFLILDEPTNDLDIMTLQVLEEFLLDFPGNLIVVSHDRYFMDKILDSLFVFKGNGEVQHFPGNYSDYRFYEGSKPKQAKPEKIESVTESKISYKNQKQINKLEGKLDRLEKQKKQLESEFLRENITQEEVNELSEKLEKTIKTLKETEDIWFEMSS